MKERGILFSGEMVRAVLDGRKTVTRRVVRFPSTGAFVLMEMNDGSFWPYVSMDGESLDDGNGNETPMRCPYGIPGDRLWVRETWDLRPMPHRVCIVGYRADYSTHAVEVPESANPSIRKGWRSARLMPRWASRITLEIVDVRPERLQEITEEDALAEGVLPDDDMRWNPIQAYEHLWGSIDPRYPWESNPVVWRIEFRRAG